MRYVTNVERIGFRKGYQMVLELSIRFGDDGLNLLTEIEKIEDYNHRETIRLAIRTVKDVSELKTLIEIETANRCVPCKADELGNGDPTTDEEENMHYDTSVEKNGL